MARKLKLISSKDPKKGFESKEAFAKRGIPDYIPKSAFSAAEWAQAITNIREGGFVSAPKEKAQGKKTITDIKKMKGETSISPIYQGAFAFAHPFKALFAGINPNMTIEEASREFYGQTLGHQIKDVGIATLGYASLIGGISALAGRGATAAASGTARITREATILNTARRGTTVTTQRAFIGKPAATGINKIFHAARPVAARFATTTKSTAITKGFLVKLGLGMMAVNLAADVIGTYPFAAFGKEEALQAISFPMTRAIDAGNLDDAQMLLDASNELIDATPAIVSKIPYKNVVQSFTNYSIAQTKANEVWQRLIDTKRQKLTEKVVRR